ncbi:MAG: diguanylate cyclase [Geminicoccaceae bacterium]|nr:MAG: diguanylate cyclase [Geminicoccaceae bacterium]
MVPRRARFLWYPGPHQEPVPAILAEWLRTNSGDQGAAPIALIAERSTQWADAPVPARSERFAAAIVTARLESGTATLASSVGADDVIVLGEEPAMISARLRRLADTAILRAEVARRRRVADLFAPPPRLGRRASDRRQPDRPAVLFVGNAGGDQLKAVDALTGWSIAAYAETPEHALRHWQTAAYHAVVVTGLRREGALQSLFAQLAETMTPAWPSLVVLRPADADYAASDAIAMGADDVIAVTDPQDLIHQRLARAIADAELRTALRCHQGFDGAVDSVSGELGYSAFHAYVTDRLAVDDTPKSALVAIELDGLDRLNLERGFVGGDAALRAVAGRLRSRVRAEDLLARIGGAAFGLWVDHIQPEDLPRLALRLQDIVARAHVRDGVEGLSARVGWALPYGMSLRNALTLSHEARAQARRHGLRAVV